MNEPIDLWLDDIRPAPEGWKHVRTVEEAKAVLRDGNVRYCSLDHDLGACDDCMQGLTPEQWLAKTDGTSMPNCSHFGTGYDLVSWMEEHNIWPWVLPRVHSANPVGRERMVKVILKKSYADCGGTLFTR